MEKNENWIWTILWNEAHVRQFKRFNQDELLNRTMLLCANSATPSIILSVAEEMVVPSFICFYSLISSQFLTTVFCYSPQASSGPAGSILSPSRSSNSAFSHTEPLYYFYTDLASLCFCFRYPSVSIQRPKFSKPTLGTLHFNTVNRQKSQN